VTIQMKVTEQHFYMVFNCLGALCSNTVSPSLFLWKKLCDVTIQMKVKINWAVLCCDVQVRWYSLLGMGMEPV